MSNESASNAPGSNLNNIHLKAAEDILRQTDSDLAVKLETLTGQVMASVTGLEEVGQVLTRTNELAHQSVASINALQEIMVTMEAVDAQILTDIGALREKFLVSVSELRAGIPRTGDGQILGDSGEPNTTQERIGSSSTQKDSMRGVGSAEGSEALEELESTSASGTSEKQGHVAENNQGLNPKCIDIVVNKVSEEIAPTEETEKTAETARVEAEARNKAEFDRLVNMYNEVNRQVDSAISLEEVGLALARTSELANTVVASIDSLNGNLGTLQAKETQVRSDIEALRQNFLASVRNLRAGLPRTDDGQMSGASGEPNATEERSGNSSTQLDTLSEVGSAEGSEALEELESTSSSGTYESVDENVQELVSKNVVIELFEEKASADDLAHSATTSETARVEAEAARVEAEAQQRTELERLVKLYIRENQEVDTVMTIEEGEAEQFLTQRIRFHEEENNNPEIAQMFAVMLEDMCPLVMKTAQDLREVQEKAPENLLTTELDLFAYVKAYGHYVDAGEYYNAQDFERVEQYIKNVVENYVKNQTAIRAGNATIRGSFQMKQLSAHLCELERKYNNVGELYWKETKKFFERSACGYLRMEPLDGPKNMFFAFVCGQLARHENPILNSDAFLIPKIVKDTVTQKDKNEVVLNYLFLIFSECTL